MLIKAKYGLIDQDLKLIKDILIEIDEYGKVISIGKYSGEQNVVDLGNVVLLPQFINSHIHILDYKLRKYFLTYYINDVVGVEYGIKYQYLKKVNLNEIEDVLDKVFQSIKFSGIGCIIPFIEYGIKFIDIILKVSKKWNVYITPFLEPRFYRTSISNEDEVNELFLNDIEEIARRRYNIAIISPLNYTINELKITQEISKRYGVLIATHVSETLDTYLDGDLQRCTYLKPHVLIHLTQIKREDLEFVKDFAKGIVITPRSNIELVGKLNFEIIQIIQEDSEVPVMIGTDNIGLIEPNLLQEIHVLYYILRLLKIRINVKKLFQMITTIPSNFWKIDYGIITLDKKLHAITIPVNHDYDSEIELFKEIVISGKITIIHLLDSYSIKQIFM